MAFFSRIAKTYRSLPRRSQWLIGIVLIGWLIWTGFHFFWGEKTPPQPEDIIYEGSPTPVVRGNLQKTLTFNGTTAFSNTQKLTFGESKLKVTNVFVKVGDTVRAWQVLATLDTSTLDNDLKKARTNLDKAKKEYEKALQNNNSKHVLLKAENELASAKVALNTIEDSIKIANAEEDSAIEKALLTLEKAKKSYDNLNCTGTHCEHQNTIIRTEKKTYEEAVENLRSIRLAIQSQLDAIDKIMYFSFKYNTHGTNTPSEYIGYNNKSTITKTAEYFQKTTQAVEELEKEYLKLQSQPIWDITLQQLEQSYTIVSKASRNLTQMSASAQEMFKATLVGWGLGGAGATWSQSDVDEKVQESQAMYTTAKSIENTVRDTLNNLYDLDTTSTLDAAKQTLDKAQLDLDKLLLAKKNRPNSNQEKRLEAQAKVREAEQKIYDLNNGYGNDEIETAKNALHDAQTAIENTIKQYERYQLIANFGGTVTEAKIQVGDTVNDTNNTYIYVENPHLIEIALQIEQADILSLNKGDEVVINLDILPEDSFSGVIAELSTVPNNGGGEMSYGPSTYTAKIIFEKPADKKILGGMSATITYTISQKSNVLLVPNPALRMGDSGMIVTMADGSTRNIEVGESDNYNTEILSGLQEGEEILSISISNNDISQAGIFDESQSGMGDQMM